MKLFTKIPLLFIFVSLTACTIYRQSESYYPYYQSESSNLSGLGVYPVAPPTEKEVEIFLQNEKPKDTAFVKLTILEVRENASYNILIQMMKEKAKTEGADAVLILDKKQEFNGDGSSYQLLTGVGIRYLKNMNYLRKYVKWQKIYFQNSADSPLISAVTISYNYDSEIWKLLPEAIPSGDTIFTKYVQRWSPHHLFSEKKNWLFHGEMMAQDDSSDSKFKSETDLKVNYVHRIVKRAYYEGEDLVKRVDIEYKNNLVSAVKITYFNEFDKTHNKIVETIHFKWNPNRTVAETMISAKNGLQFREYFFYDTEGRLQYSSLFRLVGNREIPFIKSIYEYFSLDDFADIK